MKKKYTQPDILCEKLASSNVIMTSMPGATDEPADPGHLGGRGIITTSKYFAQISWSFTPCSKCRFRHLVFIYVFRTRTLIDLKQ